MKTKKRSFPVKAALLFGAAGVLLLGSAVGSTRAALTYYSENYSAQMNMSSIGVTLLENGTAVSSRDYTDDGEWATTAGSLLTSLIPEGEKFTPGKAYTEELSVQNSGSIDTFVRVIIEKSWQKAGAKDTNLDPALIELNLAPNSGWVESTSDATPERSVFYYTNALTPGASTSSLTDSVRINNSIAQKVVKKVEGNLITYEYQYDGYIFTLEAEVNAVQTHNAEEAIRSAWGVNHVNVSEDEQSLSLQ